MYIVYLQPWWTAIEILPSASNQLWPASQNVCQPLRKMHSLKPYEKKHKTNQDHRYKKNVIFLKGKLF